MSDFKAGMLYVIDLKDNVATALGEIPQGVATFIGEKTGTLMLKEAIPFGHKAALRAIKKGGLVIKHGYPIAIATKDIGEGAWVHVHNVQSSFDSKARVKKPRSFKRVLQPVRTMSSGGMSEIRNEICQGYLRQGGRKGIRNKVLVMYTVDCSAHVAAKIQQHFFEKGFDVDVVGQRSCSEHYNRTQMLLAYCRHPNVGSVLVVGHGCESTGAAKIVEYAMENDRIAEHFFIQDAGGTTKSIGKGIAIVERTLDRLKDTVRVPFYLSDLVIGAKCGGSDATSGLVANPLVGRLFDRFVVAGATCLFSEVNEAIGLREHLVSRGVDAEAKKDLDYTYYKAEDSCRKNNQFFIRPGNIAGGLTTIEEKSQSSYAKSGTSPIQGVIKIAQSPPRRGLWLFDEMPDEYYAYRLSHEGNQGGDAAILMLMNTAGAHLNLLITGRGHTCGTGIAPTIKMTANPEVYARMSEDVDFSAAPVLDGSRSIEEMCDELRRLVEAICAGRDTNADRLGHRENEIWSVPQEP